MKKKEWNEGLNNIDPDLVEKYIQQKDKLSKNKKPKNIGLRIGVIAACLVIILCAVLASISIYKAINKEPIDHISGDKFESDTDSTQKGDNAFFDKNDLQSDSEADGIEGGKPADDPSGDVLPNSPGANEDNAPIGTDRDFEDGNSTNLEVPETEAIIATDVEGDTLLSTETIAATDIATEEIAIVAGILGEKYSNYEFIGVMCAPEKVGEKVEDVKVTVKGGYLYTLTEYFATVYNIVGVDSDFCLCIKFAAENEFFDEGYHFIRAKSFMFESLDDMRDKILGEGTLFIPSYANYTVNQKTIEEYCKNFTLSNTLSEKLKQYILTLDGLSKLTQDPSAFEEKHDEAGEFVTIYSTFNGSMGSITGLMRVYDTGYLYYSPFGGQLFHIAEDFAREIIDLVIKQGTPEGYVWNESEGKWEPIISNEIDRETFRYALAENKLWGQINLLEEISYKHIGYQGEYPSKLKLESRYLIAVAEILEAGDGNVVEIEDITSLSDVSMTFVHSWDGGETCEITVYDSGHIKLYGRYYFVGTQYTDKIINTVLLKSTNDFGLYWDKSEKVWKPLSESETQSDTDGRMTESDTEPDTQPTIPEYETETETIEWREGDLRVYGVGYGLENLQISDEQSNTVKEIWEGCAWVGDVTETMYDFVFIDGDREIRYSYVSGIFNDVTNMKSLVLTDELRVKMNDIVDHLVVLPVIN